MTSRCSFRLFPRKREGLRRVAAMLPYLAVIAICLGGWPVAAQPPAGGRWQVVLAAGDDEQPVFDNAVRYAERFLTQRGVPAGSIHRLSAAPRGPGVEAATVSRLTRRIAGLPVEPGDRCLVFITSHGAEGKGVYLAHDDEILAPAVLARALAGNCAGAPTVVIVSACYSGSFAAPPVAAPNRIVLTAARADRPSFGCQADRVYTVFDECLLGVLPRVGSWPAAFHGTDACVRGRERSLGVLPSLPQAAFGAATRRLFLWF